MTTRSLLCAFLTLAAATGATGSESAASLFPKPDVVVSCFQNNVAAAACEFKCGGGYSLSFERVSRVEIFTHGNPGRVDQRVWIAVERSLDDMRVPNGRQTSFLYLTSINACNWESLQIQGGNAEIKREMRIEKFDQ